MRVEPYDMPLSRQVLSAPIMVNLELTSACNLKCRHCYNFWRDDQSAPMEKMNREQIDRLVEMLVADQVFHVVLTGGEPLLNFEVLRHALCRLHQAGISTSVNSNLTLATPEKMARLREVGLDHILTSLNAAVPEINDYMVNRANALQKIVKGVELTVKAGIRVSANMIISPVNWNHVYETARLASRIGIQRLFVTRLVPSDTSSATGVNGLLQPAAALQAIDELLRAQDDCGIAVGSLISYPLCFLKDLQRYHAFVGRGCPAQRGNRMVISASGQAHACTHEITSYGNVFDLGIQAAFRKMHHWHEGDYRHDACRDCEYVGICQTGCRFAAYALTRQMSGNDPLFLGPAKILRPYRAQLPPGLLEAVDSGAQFHVPDGIRFRDEPALTTINVRWANAFSAPRAVGDFLRQQRRRGQPVSLHNMVGQDPRTELLYLVLKEVLLPLDPGLQAQLSQTGPQVGCSINPYDLSPQLRKSSLGLE